MIKQLLACSLAIMVTGCSSIFGNVFTTVDPPSELELAQEKMAYFKKSLKDPDSLTIVSEVITVNGNNVCFIYNAKNSFGGFNGNETAILNGKIITGRRADNRWDRMCAGGNEYPKDKFK